MTWILILAYILYPNDLGNPPGVIQAKIANEIEFKDETSCSNARDAFIANFNGEVIKDCTLVEGKESK